MESVTRFRLGVRPLAALALLAAAACQSRGAVASAGERWYRGNLHTHSLWSDGNDFPEMILEWYAERGYDFIALSDHNTLADAERWIPVPPGSPRAATYQRYLARFGPGWVQTRTVGDTLQVRLKRYDEYRGAGRAGELLVIRGEEITDRFEDRPLHMNATNLAEFIEPRGGGSVREVLQNNLDAVLEQRERLGQPMFPHVNHPNFGWAVTVEDLMGLEGERFFEVYNGHPLVNNEGDPLHPSTERMWDILLAHQRAADQPVMLGLATDDSHTYDRWDGTVANPGRGWIMVRASERSPEALIEAMERGDFYGSSGVRLREIGRSGDRLRVEIDAQPGVTYTTRFIGTRRGFDPRSEPVRDERGREVSRRYSDDIGQVLAEVTGPVAEYTLRGDELYVRARIVSSRPKENPYRAGELETAWTQPWLEGNYGCRLPAAGCR